MEKRIEELELRYMHQEKAIQELSEIVSRQELLLEQLRREIIVIKEQALLELPTMDRDAEQEKPPHY
ncbi:MAG: SlyX family protein [Deltaproteobacteria bacterium]|nr:SlyX family protein [Deltaproteobacteria bacterium]